MPGTLHQVFDPLQELLVSQGLGFAEVTGILSILILFMTFPWRRIYRRAGCRPALGVLMLVPVINVFMFLLLAYYEWPIERERHAQSTVESWR